MSNSRRWFWLASTVPLIILLLTAHASASAPRRIDATFTVNSTADVVDRRPGDGKCETAKKNKVCTLRAAIMETNALAGNDTIILPANTYHLTIPGANEDDARQGDLDVKDDLVINGAGAATTIIDGNTTITGDRVFHILGGVAVKFSSITIEGGQVQLDFGGGIFNSDGKVTVTNSTIFGNAAFMGGGIFNLNGVMKIVRSTIDHNTSPFQSGGGIYNGSGVLTMNKSTLTNNFAGNRFGGGLYNIGKLTIKQSLIANNEGFHGGGLFSEGTVKILKSTFRSNYANSGSGGGIFQESSTLLIQESTLSGNSAGGIGGGAIYIGASNINIVNSTVSGNSAVQGGGILNGRGIGNLFNVTVGYNNASSLTGGGIYSDSNATFNIANSLIANNSGDCSGVLTSQDYNLVQDTTNCTIIGPALHNIYGQDPNLGGLSNYGGPTETHALLSPSPAIDAGNLAGCTNHLGAALLLDQRGQARPVDGDSNGKKRCDIGAFEYRP